MHISARVEVAYNVINAEHIRHKHDYALHSPKKILSVGRQFKDKNPENIIHAVADMENVELTLVGDGPYHEKLKNLATQKDALSKIKFISSIPNQKLCQEMADYDLFVLHTEYWELSKSLLEPLLTGLPIVLNKREGRPIPELEGKDLVYYVENTPVSYRQAFIDLFEDDKKRENLGQHAKELSGKFWAPYETEKKFVNIYKNLMES